MLRSRSKRAEWQSNVDLPISASSSSSSLEDKPNTRRRPTGFFCQTSNVFLVFSVLLVFLLVMYGVSLLQISAGSRGVVPSSDLSTKSYPNAPVVMPSKAKIIWPSKPPLVDRSILDKLVLMYQSGDDPDDRLPPPNLQTHKPAWPPAVTRIPEAKPSHLASNLQRHKFQHEPVSKASPGEFDLSMCGVNTCRFLLPLRIAEQESKAHIHFLQILELAGRLNRIVVLPNVGKSRMGSCFRWNFEKYYDTKSLQPQLAGGAMRVIDMETFRLWTATRPLKPISQMVSIESKPLTGPPSSAHTLSFANGITIKVEHDQDPSDSKRARCLKSKFPRLGLVAFSPLSIYPSKEMKNRPFGPAVVDALDREDVRSASFREAEGASLDTELREHGHDRDATSTDPDVLILNYNLRYPIFPTSQTLSYSPVLSAFATNLLAPLEPRDYLVVHWRMESIAPTALSGCAAALVRTLTGLLKNEKRIKTVWLASDYPYPVSRPSPPNPTQRDGKSKSGTFRVVGPLHEGAIDILRNAFEEGGPLEGRRIVGLAEQLASIRATTRTAQTGIGIKGELLEDSGVLGILDKIVAIQAGLFVSGGKGCGRVSSFTKQIVQARRGMMGTKKEQIGNVVKYFM